MSEGKSILCTSVCFESYFWLKILPATLFLELFKLCWSLNSSVCIYQHTFSALATLFYKSLRHRCFPVNFVKFLRTIFYRTPPVAAFVQTIGSSQFVSVFPLFCFPVFCSNFRSPRNMAFDEFSGIRCCCRIYWNYGEFWHKMS